MFLLPTLEKMSCCGPGEVPWRHVPRAWNTLVPPQIPLGISDLSPHRRWKQTQLWSQPVTVVFLSTSTSYKLLVEQGKTSQPGSPKRHPHCPRFFLEEGNGHESAVPNAKARKENTHRCKEEATRVAHRPPRRRAEYMKTNGKEKRKHNINPQAGRNDVQGKLLGVTNHCKRSRVNELLAKYISPFIQ